LLLLLIKQFELRKKMKFTNTKYQRAVDYEIHKNRGVILNFYLQNLYLLAKNLISFLL